MQVIKVTKNLKFHHGKAWPHVHSRRKTVFRKPELHRNGPSNVLRDGIPSFRGCPKVKKKKFMGFLFKKKSLVE